MCGLAGYNITPEWANKYLDEEKMEQILQEAWFHNIHRGWDAAGFFAIERKTDKLTVFKKPGVASDIYKKEFLGKNKVPVARVFGAHTRDPSTSKKADAKSNLNNHPLHWNGVWVTHNGTLKNEDEVKAVHKAMSDKFIPDVDSVAIAMILSEIHDPEDHIDEIASALGYLEGSFAIHAIWRDYPGLSLFARGKVKEFIFATHPVGAFVYGSEEDSVWSQIRMMGLNPNDDAWEWSDLNEDNLIMVKDGKPIHWGNFKKFRPDEQKPATERILPTLSEEEDDIVIYSTKSEYDFANRAQFRSALDVENSKDYSIVYDATDKARMAALYPVSHDSHWEAVFSEADRVYKIKDKYHAFFGNVELVMTGSRTLQDVYNHNRFDNLDRWKSIKPEDVRLIGDRIDFDQYRRFQTKPPVAVPDKQERYWFEVQLERSANNQYPFLGGWETAGIGCDILPGQQRMESDEEIQAKRELANREREWDEYNYVAPTMNVGWEEVYGKLISHVVDPTLAFLYEAECPKHEGQMFKSHFDPHSCQVLLNSAAFTLCCFNDVGAYRGLSDDLNVDWDMQPGHCGSGKNGKACDWKAGEYIEIFYKTSRFEMITEQVCIRCFSRRKLTTLPIWMRYIDHTGRIPISMTRYIDKEDEEKEYEDSFGL